MLMKLTCALALFLLPMFVCAQSELLPKFTTNAPSDLPVMQAGTVTVSGRITLPPGLKRDSIWVQVTVPQPFTGENKRYRTLVGTDGRFSVKVNTETNRSICAIKTDINEMHTVTTFLTNGRASTVAINYNEDGDIDKMKTNDAGGLTENDLVHGVNKFSALSAHKSNKPRPTLYDKPFSDFFDHTNKVLRDRWGVLNQSTLLSNKMKVMTFRDFALRIYQVHLFDYEREMILNYMNTHQQQMPDSAMIRKPDRAYFSFLKNLNLNNPLNLYTYALPDLNQEILRNPILNIPRVQDTPIDEWTNNTKAILAPLVGFDKGMYYDMLVGNAYAMQFELEVQPLSEKQIANIKKHFKGNDLEKMLLRRNQEIIDAARFKENLVVNETPAVPVEKLMDAIVARYKGKTVVIDLWATWCIPCHDAINESRELRARLKDVVFVYVTGPSSPKKLWQSQVQGIGGEHYYITKDEMDYVYRHFKLGGLPSYLVYGRDGGFREMVLGWPGNGEMEGKLK
ncbi:TlpA family protein disulfide reductase [Chitinophaga horti]|uniref:TlpA family protein disulfide reductase n=1 Tax=Chitinophaga horti TaxID=2920382 RepID=A0ABY6J856_9BACT|nr:TlpA family protein disulfide reductase [Chitinophaga horti]UYQ95665.1 TlpA family protein disulfide reductase [Chitinophaga horti]